MHCIIIEDQRPAQEILEKYIKDLGSLQLRGVFTDALQAMHILNEQSIDLIFLDIHLPKLSGVDFLKALNKPPKVIFTTAFPDYALEGYELDVVDYLLKPFSFQRFVKAVAKASAQQAAGSDTLQEEKVEKDIFIKSGYDHIRVAIEEICYLKADTDYTEFHIGGQKCLSAESLKYWEEKLSAHDFIRIHKSYLVNTAKVQKVAGSHAHLEDDTRLPIGRAYKDDFFKKVLK